MECAEHELTLCSVVEESGVNDSVENKFPGASVTYGSAASGAGNNREIPDSEGGNINSQTGRYVFSLFLCLPCMDPSPLLLKAHIYVCWSHGLKYETELYECIDKPRPATSRA